MNADDRMAYSMVEAFGDFARGMAKLARAPLSYGGFLASQIRRALMEGKLSPEATGLVVDQFQSNGSWGVHQLRVTLPESLGTYRVIVAPPDAPVFIGKVHADQHFLEPLIPPPAEPPRAA